MPTLKAEFEIVTPVIMGGGKSDQLVHRLRPPSIKGALRFWWRARHWSRHFHANNGDGATALRSLHAEEAELFGVASGQDQGRQSRVLLQIASRTHRGQISLEKPDRNAQAHRDDKDDDGIRYLLGQGLQKRPVGLLGTFDLCIRLHRSVTDSQIESLTEGLWLFGLLGGLGARSRRGIGSIALRSLEGYSTPQTTQDYTEELNAILADMSKSVPPFSALSEKTQFTTSQMFESYSSALDSVGKKFQQYRDHDRFRSDTEIAKKISEGKSQDCPPRRIAFGLPHNYFFKGKEKKDNKQVDIQPSTSKRDRRASPLFFHIHILPGEPKPFIAALLHLPSTFLPKGDLVGMSYKKRFSVSVDPHHDEGVVPAYLEHFSDPKGSQE